MRPANLRKMDAFLSAGRSKIGCPSTDAQVMHYSLDILDMMTGGNSQP
jgi:hypothetical protein